MLVPRVRAWFSIGTRAMRWTPSRRRLEVAVLRAQAEKEAGGAWEAMMRPCLPPRSNGRGPPVAPCARRLARTEVWGERELGLLLSLTLKRRDG